MLEAAAEARKTPPRPPITKGEVIVEISGFMAEPYSVENATIDVNLALESCFAIEKDS